MLAFLAKHHRNKNEFIRQIAAPYAQDQPTFCQDTGSPSSCWKAAGFENIM
jgi:hypothetical protein